MITTQQTLDMAPIGMVMRVMKTAAETNGQSFEMEWTLLPKADGMPVHLHPKAAETYRVLERQLEVCVNGKWQLLSSGETLTILSGTPHTFRNPLDATTQIYNTHTPAMQFDHYFEELRNIVAKLSARKPGPLTVNLRVATYLSMLMKKFPAELVSVSPPGFVVSVLNALGKLGGIRI